VPGIAKLAGKRDPHENAVSHMFAQQVLCVAMEFPGWFKAACAGFFVSGLLEAFPFFRVYRLSWLRYGGEGPRKGGPTKVEKAGDAQKAENVTSASDPPGPEEV